METTAARLAARSIHGCWTCRLRRKKCDERRPSCSTCICLELDCHGYGPKPLWMDQGILQKAQALEFKRIVRQTKSKRLRQRSLHPAYSLQKSDGLQTDETSAEASPPFTPDRETTGTQTGNIFQDDKQFQIRASDISTFDNLVWNSPFDDTISSSQHFLIQGGNLPATSKGYIPDPLAIDNSDMEMNMFSSQSQSTSTSPTGHENNILWDNELSQRNIVSRKDPPSQERSLPQVNYENAFVFNEPVQYNSSYNQFLRPRTLEETLGLNPISRGRSSLVLESFVHSASYQARQSPSSLGGITEDSLFMYYLDHIFHIQYPFYSSFNGQGRGWLFSILTRAKSAYHATLALSEHYQHRTKIRSLSIAESSDYLRAKGGHYDLALREMHHSLENSDSWSRTGDLGQIIQVLTCILQLLFLELFTSGTADWRTHISAAATFLPALLHVQTLSVTSASPISDYETDCLDRKSLRSDSDTAVSFLLGSFVSFDIIAAASSRSYPILQVDHRRVLEQLGIDLKYLTACENWVMILIFEISRLDDWKSKAEKAHNLSIVELAKRGGEIREYLQRRLADIDLRRRLADIDNVPSTKPSPSDVSKFRSRRNHLETTKIFALSAMTYLNVVLSGANPNLPEIAESVSDTIAAFKAMNDPDMFRNIVWPFCITGCLASEEQQDFFRSLWCTANAKGQDLGTCVKAFEIIKECWRLRKAGSRLCDWASVIETSGCSILLA
ncbi:hypothetical protein N431DRAFT_521727 [Stipitochalara longipes BDJ]|nr:hypothetical protein N431DRAFT_521727 [Stipitochalara longipes BDJ]